MLGAGRQPQEHVRLAPNINGYANGLEAE